MGISQSASSVHKREPEGEIPFTVSGAGKQCATWYKVIGDLNNSSLTPLIAAHGGPGATHLYLKPLEDLYKYYGVPVIFYDQLGCGRSTHLPEKKGDEKFWTPALFVHELDNLVDYFGLRKRGFDFLGHSWGGYLGVEYAVRSSTGLRKLILSDTPSSSPLMDRGVNLLVNKLPESVQKALRDADRTGEYDNDAYKEACMVFYNQHVCRIDPWPQEVVDSLTQLEEDPTVYRTM